MTRERVVVAMSGGVDSAIAAARVVASGREAIGISLRLARDGSGSCCSLDDFHDAAAVADRLGIPHYVFDFRDQFTQQVVDPFVREYLRGRTPNPCARCNEHLKFGTLWERARELGATRLATGHYARIGRHPASGRPALRMAADGGKDQSYFLFMLDHQALARTDFPVGKLGKAEVRAEAARLGLSVAEKPESMEICFVPRRDTGAFVERHATAAACRPGVIEDDRGRTLGRHDGIHRFTVGQRRGLGLSGAEPRYVTRIEPARNVVVVGPRTALTSRGVCVAGVVWGEGIPPPAGSRLGVRIRHRHPLVEARLVHCQGDRATLRFEGGGPAVTPGQAAVFYQGDLVLGGGWIEEPLS